jgi:acyl-CoA synthetase (AMP-forming)/AMP-acid ligase II
MQLSISAFLAKRAMLNPTMEAVVDVATGERISYAELDARSTRAALRLRALGVEPGDRVAILAMNSPLFIDTYLGAARLGAITVPLNWRLVADELTFIVGDAGAVVLVAGDEFAAVGADVAGRPGSPVRHLLGPGWQDGALADALPGEPLAADPLYIMYTSGTTGLPKGAVHTNASASWGAINMVASMDYQHGDRYLNCMPLFHVGSLVPLNACIYRGCTTVLMKAFDPVGIWDVVGAERACSFLAVPSMLNLMGEGYDADPERARSVRWMVTAGAPVPTATLDAWSARGVDIVQGYGLTECGGPATILSPAEAAAHMGSAGKAFFHADVAIVRRDGSVCDPGEAGEVVVRSDGNMIGYWNRPDATAETIVDGWLHTGDVAVMDADGYVTIQDRIKDMIISGGENIYPAELENVILAHPGVREVAVIAQPSARWGESPAAVVVRADEALTEADILAWCAGKLARYKQPKAVVFAAEIPRNPSGKALKRILRDQFPGPAPE